MIADQTLSHRRVHLVRPRRIIIIIIIIYFGMMMYDDDDDDDTLFLHMKGHVAC